MRVLPLLLLLLAGCGPSLELNHNLAPTPPMGWNSWNKFACGINEQIVHGIADAMVTTGMQAVGYRYVIVDDCWQMPDRENGHLVANPDSFPEGMKALADYVHSKGLKFGLYSDRGRKTCENKAGSYDHETIDAQDFAAWGVDYVKYDNCNPALLSDQESDFRRMRQCLNNSGRPIVFSICCWGFGDWMPNVGDLWRTTGDITDKWSRFIELVDTNEQYASFNGISHWNDPDMLEVGNGGMTDNEYRAQFSMWAVMAAPLIAGNDLRNMSKQTQETLTNAEVIAVDQDALGIQGTMVDSSGKDLLVYSKALKDPLEKAVVLFNKTEQAQPMTLRFEKIGLVNGPSDIRDLWAHKTIHIAKGPWTVHVPAHSVIMVKVRSLSGRPLGDQQPLQLPGAPL